MALSDVAVESEMVGRERDAGLIVGEDDANRAAGWGDIFAARRDDAAV